MKTCESHHCERPRYKSRKGIGIIFGRSFGLSAGCSSKTFHNDENANFRRQPSGGIEKIGLNENLVLISHFLLWRCWCCGGPPLLNEHRGNTGGEYQESCFFCVICCLIRSVWIRFHIKLHEYVITWMKMLRFSVSWFKCLFLPSGIKF